MSASFTPEGGPHRILVYGVTGSGKSTLAEHIAQRTGLPFHEVDTLTWEPQWQAVPTDEQRRRLAELCAGDRWILDSAYSVWIDLVLPRVQLVVALDYPRWLSLGRLTRRALRRATDHQLICNGNTETFRQMVSRNSIILWHFRSFNRKRARMRSWDRDGSGVPVVRLRSSRATREWLATFATTATSSSVS